MKDINKVSDLIKFLEKYKDFKLNIFRIKTATNFFESDIDIDHKTKTVIIDGQYDITGR